MKHLKTFENKLQDDILDYMLDNKLKYEDLDKETQYMMKHGEENPEEIFRRKKEKNTFIGIKNKLEFIYDRHEIKDYQLIVYGTMIYLGDKYEGEFALGNGQGYRVEFFNSDEEEFDPRNNKEHTKGMEKILSDVAKRVNEKGKQL